MIKVDISNYFEKKFGGITENCNRGDGSFVTSADVTKEPSPLLDTCAAKEDGGKHPMDYLFYHFIIFTFVTRKEASLLCLLDHELFALFDV